MTNGLALLVPKEGTLVQNGLCYWGFQRLLRMKLGFCSTSYNAERVQLGELGNINTLRCKRCTRVSAGIYLISQLFASVSSCLWRISLTMICSYADAPLEASRFFEKRRSWRPISCSRTALTFFSLSPSSSPSVWKCAQDYCPGACISPSAPDQSSPESHIVKTFALVILYFSEAGIFLPVSKIFCLAGSQ